MAEIPPRPPRYKIVNMGKTPSKLLITPEMNRRKKCEKCGSRLIKDGLLGLWGKEYCVNNICSKSKNVKQD